MMPPLPARLRYSSGVNFVFDGNSLFWGAGASSNAKRVPEQTVALAPVAGSGATMSNLGISGQTWRQMNGLDGGSSADVDAAWMAGKKNILVLWETTNAVYNPTQRTGVQAAADCQAYVAARLAAHPWTIINVSTLPRQDPTQTQSTTDAYNNELLTADAIIRANYRAWGMAAMVELRSPGSPFAIPDFTPASFALTPALWSDNPHIHLTDAGYAVVAALIAAKLRQLSPR